jgi:hypothetical protein
MIPIEEQKLEFNFSRNAIQNISNIQINKPQFITRFTTNVEPDLKLCNGVLQVLNECNQSDFKCQLKYII